MKYLILAGFALGLSLTMWLWVESVRECRRVHPLWYCVVHE